MQGARGVIINITGGPDLTLAEVSEASDIIYSAAHEDANIIFGAVVDPKMEGKVKITVIATGFDRARGGHRRRPRSPPSPRRSISAPTRPRAGRRPTSASSRNGGRVIVSRRRSSICRASPAASTLPPADDAVGRRGGAVAARRAGVPAEAGELRHGSRESRLERSGDGLARDRRVAAGAGTRALRVQWPGTESPKSRRPHHSDRYNRQYQ